MEKKHSAWLAKTGHFSLSAYFQDEWYALHLLISELIDGEQAPFLLLALRIRRFEFTFERMMESTNVSIFSAGSMSDEIRHQMLKAKVIEIWWFYFEHAKMNKNIKMVTGCFCDLQKGPSGHSAVHMRARVSVLFVILSMPCVVMSM